MNKPRKATYNQRRETSTLYFKNLDDSKEFYMRGAVCWPEGDSDGFAIMAGQQIDNGQVYVFEQAGFITIDDIRGKDQIIKYHGLASWLNRCWSKYFARRYFWNQPQAIHDRFRLQIYRSRSVEPKPGFIEIDLGKTEERPLVADFIRTELLIVGKDSELAEQLDIARQDEKAELPAVRALGRCLAGLQRFPFARDHVEEEDFDIF
jgi:hypothetical protein